MADYLNNAKDTVKQSIPSAEAVSAGISNVANSVRDTTQKVSADFSAKSMTDASTDFLNSNSLIARFVFIILVLIAFMIILNLGVGLISYLMGPNPNPYIIHGTLPGTAERVFSQDPASTKAIVYRSNNKSGGAEFTWSLWLKLDSLPKKTPNVSWVFVKGSESFDTNGYAEVNNGPGVYLDSSGLSADVNGTSARLIYKMDVVSPVDQTNNPNQDAITAIIPNLPIGKWFHVAIRLQNKTLDCYVNGVITTRLSFGDLVPKQNYDPIAYAKNNGFGGAISNLRYYSYALSVFELNNIVYYGPNLKSAETGSGNSYFDYLGKRWYKSG